MFYMEFLDNIRNGNLEAVKEFCSKYDKISLNKNQSYVCGATGLFPLPLIVAFQHNRLAIARYLMRHGAKLDVLCQKTNRTPREFMPPPGVYEELNRQLFKACLARKSSKIRSMLEAGADANFVIPHSFDAQHCYDDMEGMTPLMVYLDCSKAYYDKEVEHMLPTVQCFLDYGADINHIAVEHMLEPGHENWKYQWSPLSYSNFQEGTILMEYLLKHGADPNLIRADDGGSFLDSVSMDYDVAEMEVITDAKINLLKRYGAKSAWAGEI